MLLKLFYLCLVLVGVHCAPSRRNLNPTDRIKFIERANDVLDRVPLIDGHNDWPISMRDFIQNRVGSYNLSDLSQVKPWVDSTSSHTDIKRLRQGKVGAQFWAAFVGCSTQYKDAVAKTWEQIDVIHRMVDANPDVFEFVTTAEGIESAFSRGKIGSLIGVEGGHSIGYSLAILRMMYSMGARYLTLTHSCTTPWGDNSQLDDPGNKPVHDGLTSFGKTVVLEMNRLGMLVDLSHVSRKTMLDALEVSKAPIIFSHSSIYAVCNDSRNVQDDVIRKTAQNGGVIMINFFNGYVTCSNTATVADVADHMDHVRNLVGTDYIGVGADFNGVSQTPEGLKDVSQYPNLFAELLSRGWSESELEKVAGLNLIRVFKAVEKFRDQMVADGVKPYEDWIPAQDLPQNSSCITPN